LKGFLDSYEEQLIDAAFRELQPQARRRRLRGRSAALAVAFAVLLISASAVAATGSWRDVLGIDDASTTTDAPPPARELAILGVLRRPPTAGDLGQAARDALQYFGSQPSGLRPAYIRLVAKNEHGEGIVLVPAVAYNPKFIGGSPSLRARLVRSSPVCLFYPDPLATGGVRNCWGQEDIEAGKATASLGLHQYGLVPDGVARVEAVYDGGMDASGEVRDNFFDIAAPRNPEDPEVVPKAPQTLVWFDSAGRERGRWAQP
jgi:hypothetical protein